jgi:hypothetical protein
MVVYTMLAIPYLSIYLSSYALWKGAFDLKRVPNGAKPGINYHLMLELMLDATEKNPRSASQTEIHQNTFGYLKIYGGKYRSHE